MAEEQSAASSAAGDDRALLQRALAFHRAGRLDQAAAIYGRILAADADNVEALHFLGVIDAQFERFDKAAERLQRAVELQPDNTHFWSNLATVRLALGELEAAETACRRAIELKPENADALTNFGNVLAAQGKPKDALTAYHAAVKIEPKHRDALNNLGLTLRDLGKSELALSVFQEVVHLAPDFAEAHVNLAHGLLAAGRFQEGWSEYAWRWKTRRGAGTLRSIRQPLWNGEPLNGRRLLVWCEDDIDEQIFFASLLPDLAALDGQVLVECAPRLAGLFDRSFPTYVLLPRMAGQGRGEAPGAEDEVPDFDLQIPLSGLAGLFRKHRAAFPHGAAYLQPDEAVAGYLRRNYKELAERRRVIGIAWQPSPADAGPVAFPSPRDWRPILDVEGCLFIDLQHGQAEAEVAALVGKGAHIHGDPAIDPTESLDDFAAQLAALDLVIAAAGTTAHLAAAIGRPTFCLAPCGPSWRWLGVRGLSESQRAGGQPADSQWYPGLRLFCPDSPGAWDAALGRIAVALTGQLAGCRPLRPQGPPKPDASRPGVPGPSTPG
jgi:Flp pilus assembly protein TadD